MYIIHVLRSIHTGARETGGGGGGASPLSKISLPFENPPPPPKIGTSIKVVLRSKWHLLQRYVWRLIYVKIQCAVCCFSIRFFTKYSDLVKVFNLVFLTIFRPI